MKLLASIRSWLLYKLWRPKDRFPEEIEQFRWKGQVLAKQIFFEDIKHNRCRHLKGGNLGNCFSKSYGPGEIQRGLDSGTSRSYAVIKHQFANGDIWITCPRCGKKWKPPIRASFKKQADYDLAIKEYQTAFNFETNNSTSSSIQMRFSDDGAAYRKSVENS